MPELANSACRCCLSVSPGSSADAGNHWRSSTGSSTLKIWGLSWAFLVLFRTMRMPTAQSVIKTIAPITIPAIEPEERLEDWAIDEIDGRGVSDVETFEV